MTTEELIAEIERLDAAATSGPWKASGAGADSWVFAADGRRFDIGDRLYHPENDANAHLIASYRTLAVEAARRLRETEKDKAFYKDAAIRQNFEIEQILGKALGYPWYKDDQQNFPGSTDADGVCVGEHTPGSIADEAAKRIRELTDRISVLEEILGSYS